jgi:hypothetical protein
MIQTPSSGSSENGSLSRSRRLQQRTSEWSGCFEYAGKPIHVTLEHLLALARWGMDVVSGRVGEPVRSFPNHLWCRFAWEPGQIGDRLRR